MEEIETRLFAQKPFETLKSEDTLEKSVKRQSNAILLRGCRFLVSELFTDLQKMLKQAKFEL